MWFIGEIWMKYIILNLAITLNLSLLLSMQSRAADIPIYLTYQTNQTDEAIQEQRYISECHYFQKTLWNTHGAQKVFIFQPNPNLYSNNKKKIPPRWFACDENGQLVRSGPGSGGKPYCPDIGESCFTPTGHFRVYRKEDEDYKSTIFPIEKGGGAPMPYAMFFKDGAAIHGSDFVVPRNASHGCIRVTPEDAKWLSEEFIEIGTKVVVLPYE